MKKVVSVVATPFRAILRILLKMLRPLRRIGTPFVKLTKLRGRPLIIACAVILAVLLVAAVALKPAPDSEEEVRATLDRYAAASRDKDYQTLCDDLLSSELVERIRSAGLPCEVALRTGLENRQNPTLKVLAIEVSGDEAAARVSGSAVGEVPGVATYRLIHEDGSWHIATPPGSESSP
jgi:hypothetical protein